MQRNYITSVFSVSGRFRFLLCLGLMLPAWCQAAVTTAVDAQTGLHSWEWREQGASIRLVQRLPDQTRAFFQARGFAAADADRIARQCLFQTIVRNDGQVPMVYDLEDWRVLRPEQSGRMVTRARWAEYWADDETGGAARIALHWALLPDIQRFEPGDYNWGMSSYGLPPGAEFDLEFVLSLGSNRITRSIAGIVCAPDLSGD